MKKLITLLAAGITALSMTASATVVLNSTLASETFLAHNATYASSDLSNLKVIGLTGQVVYTSAATPTPVTFQAGSQSVGSITIANFAVLNATAATNTLNVASLSGLTDASITLPGYVFRQGIDWATQSTASGTAESIRLALIRAPFIQASRSVSTITLTTPIGTLYNTYGFTTSVPSSLVIATPLFTGGRNNAIVTVNGVALTQGTQWTASVSSATTATSLTSAINTALGSVLTATANSPTNGIVAIVSDANGASSNFALASSVAAITLSGATMTGGVTANFTAGSPTITTASHNLTLGTPILYTATGTIAPLSAGTTYFAIPVTATSLKLASSKVNALAGTAITITEATPHLTAVVGTLAALGITGTPSLKWQSSNDNSTWADISVSSVTMLGYASPTRTESWNFGSIAFKFIRANVVSPLTGGLALNVSITGSDSILEQAPSDPKMFLDGPNNPGSPTIFGTMTATAFVGNGAGLTGVASSASVAAKLDKVGTSSLTITGAAGTILTQSSVTASAFFGNGGALTGIASGVCALGSGVTSVDCSGASNTTAALGSVVSGGKNNDIASTADFAGVGSGYNNDAATPFSFIGGGSSNTVTSTIGHSHVIAGGNDNHITGDYTSVIGGGYLNTITNDNSTIAGGGDCHITNSYGAIGGGFQSNISGAFSVVGGGENNTAGASANTTVSGGGHNVASGAGGTVSGGISNTASGTDSTVTGGFTNSAQGSYSVVGGRNQIAFNDYGALLSGRDGLNSGEYSIIAGGTQQIIRAGADRSAICGGDANEISQDVDWGFIGGGFSNNLAIGSSYGGILSGRSCTVTGQYAQAGGRRAKAFHDGSFVWADSTDADFTSTGANSFNVRAAGGAQFTVGTSTFTGILSIGSGTNIIYYCSGSTAGVFDGNLARGNANAGACSGGTWVATSLKLN